MRRKAIPLAVVTIIVLLIGGCVTRAVLKSPYFFDRDNTLLFYTQVKLGNASRITHYCVYYDFIDDPTYCYELVLSQEDRERLVKLFTDNDDGMIATNQVDSEIPKSWKSRDHVKWKHYVFVNKSMVYLWLDVSTEDNVARLVIEPH